MQTTSGLSYLIHGVISYPDATSCDKDPYYRFIKYLFHILISNKEMMQ